MKEAHDHSRLSFYTGIPGNRVKLLVDAVQGYPAMLAAIDAAHSTVALESYIYAPDATGQRFLEALVRAQTRGVQVRVIIDAVGSAGTRASFFAPLLQAGGQMAVFQPNVLGLPTWRRDHRKILVVDERQAFIGGLNIAQEYAPQEWGGGSWHDIHAEVDGPVAFALGRLFARTWQRVAQRPWLPVRTPSALGEISVQILESELIVRRHSVRKAYLHAIRHARHTVRLSNAYFIPDRGILRALRLAAERGVKVQILLAGRSDVQAVRYASCALYARILRFGAEIYEWPERMLHAKCAVIDGSWCSIGSYNLDRRSLVHNLEANIACVDSTLGAAMDAQFVLDAERSKRVDPETWHRRPVLRKLLEQVFYSLRYLL